MLSSPTGLSFKKWSGSTMAIGGGVAWGFGDRDIFRVHVDYLFHNFGLFQMQKGSLPLYYCIGGQIEFEDIGIESQNDDNEVGVRAPIGINYIFEDLPVDAFFEIVPRFNLAPTTAFKISGGIGIRYFFD